MSKIIQLPGKPNWLITISIDDKGLMQIGVKDETVLPGVTVARQPNQIELAILLNTAVQSLLQTTLNVTRGRTNGT